MAVDDRATVDIGLSPFAEQDVVLDALNRRRRGDRDSWETFAVLSLLGTVGMVIAVAGTPAHRLILTIPVPLLVALGVGWLRQGAIARSLQAGVLRGDADALADTARFLDRHDERNQAASALRLAAANTDDPFESGCLDLQARHVIDRGREPAPSPGWRAVAGLGYVCAAAIVVVAAWALDLAQRTTS